ncbi:swarming motility [Acidovorax phage ACP17]|uniref:Swarming motility n=1 Tax=Acidovorax phage ACP17 TaxID=2010329 RepID=A0A218M3C3_9CAUD|nr:swarming motility [Acidovorax phage ACP17]ASD50538.1 swarming motility [Acidovorax phage ACP17]
MIHIKLLFGCAHCTTISWSTSKFFPDGSRLRPRRSPRNGHRGRYLRRAARVPLQGCSLSFPKGRT